MDVDAQHRQLVMALEVVRVPVFTDNYVWLLHDGGSRETVAIDPGEATPVLEAADARGWRIGQVWLTHWHADHIGGAERIRAATAARLTGPAAEAARLPRLDVAVREGDRVAIGAHRGTVIEVPAHTAGHIAYHLPDDALVFVGDTLFAMGCGRLFEGTPAQMWANMQRLAALPPETQVYAGHEYTLGNARFAVTIEPDNEAVAERLRVVTAARDRGEATLPTTIALERATNPFVRAGSADALAERRAAKDAFAG